MPRIGVEEARACGQGRAVRRYEGEEGLVKVGAGVAGSVVAAERREISERSVSGVKEVRTYGQGGAQSVIMKERKSLRSWSGCGWERRGH